LRGPAAAAAYPTRVEITPWARVGGRGDFGEGEFGEGDAPEGLISASGGIAVGVEVREEFVFLSGKERSSPIG